jgi:putative ABC transport system substrate-binding protein
VAPNNAAAHAARSATETIPIVMAGVGDAVEEGLIQSLARPAGNVTANSEVIQ